MLTSRFLRLKDNLVVEIALLLILEQGLVIDLLSKSGLRRLIDIAPAISDILGRLAVHLAKQL